MTSLGKHAVDHSRIATAFPEFSEYSNLKLCELPSTIEYVPIGTINKEEEEPIEREKKDIER